MPRKTLDITIDAPGRDKGKTFRLHEAPADTAENWFIRLVLAISNAGGKIPDDVLFAGAAGFAQMLPTIQNSLVVGLRAMQGLAFAEVKPLLEEMKPWVSWLPPGGAPEQKIFPGDSSQIEEVSTWFKLRFELIQLHLGFSLGVDALTTGDSSSSPSSAT